LHRLLQPLSDQIVAKLSCAEHAKHGPPERPWIDRRYRLGDVAPPKRFNRSIVHCTRELWGLRQGVPRHAKAHLGVQRMVVVKDGVVVHGSGNQLSSLVAQHVIFGMVFVKPFHCDSVVAFLRSLCRCRRYATACGTGFARSSLSTRTHFSLLFRGERCHIVVHL